jgi:hypothetical protein
MAHFAQIENSQVVNILVVLNEDIGNLPFPESEPVGRAFLDAIFPGNEWQQTSYNRNFRKNYATIGGVFDAARDAFIGVQPYENWVLNEDACIWIPPVPYPEDGKGYSWDQRANAWIISRVPVTVIGEQ